MEGKKEMLAARLHKIGDFSADRIPIPVPRGEELLVKIGACGVCGSDLPRIYRNGTGNGVYPLTLGHEFAGEIVDAGDAKNRDLIGKRGAFFPLIPCFKCENCLAGHYAMCRNYSYMGSRRDGGFAEYCLVPDKWHFIESKNPEVSFESLAMVEPACVAQHAMLRKSGFFAGANVIIYGAGPIGIMGARWAEIAGAGHILLIDVTDEKVAFAEKSGFKAYNSAKGDLTEAVLSSFGGRLADIVVEGTGYGSALENAIMTVRTLGRIVLLGNPAGNTTISQKAHSLLLRKEITVQGIWNSHFQDTPVNAWRYAVEMIDSGAFVCDDLVTHRTGIEELPAVIDKMYRHEISYCKILCVPGLSDHAESKQ